MQVRSSSSASTSGTWELYFDGSDVGLIHLPEDIWGTWIDPSSSDIYLTTKGEFWVTGLSGNGKGNGNDIFVCEAPTVGSDTACEAFSLFFDGDENGLHDRKRIDGFDVD